MPSYTKLFQSIVTSSIWSEDDKTRILWVTMLAIADKHGEVHASIPGLARLAGIPIPDTERALKKLLSPDEYSRTKDLDGVRIVEIDGGWELVNHGKYRRMASKEDAQEANRIRQQRWKNRKKGNAPVTPSNAPVTQDRDIAEAEAEVKKGDDKSSPCPISSDAQADFLETLWKAAPKQARERSSRKQLEDAWKRTPVGMRPEPAEALMALEAWKLSESWTKDDGQFVKGIHLWVKNRQWRDAPDKAKPRPKNPNEVNFGFAKGKRK